MYSMDDFLRFECPKTARRSPKARNKACVLSRPRTVEINAFLEACGLKAKHKQA